MPRHGSIAIDRKAPPFDEFKSIRWLASARSGQHSHERARHHLYVGTGKKRPVDVLIKVTSKPGRVYEQDLENEIATLGTINRELPDSRYFPCCRTRAPRDGRLYLVMSLFDEFPLATTIGAEPARPARRALWRPSRSHGRSRKSIASRFFTSI